MSLVIDDPTEHKAALSSLVNMLTGQPIYAGPYNTTTDDNRSEEQKKTHTRAVVMKDTFMSGWGKAGRGWSMCGWALDPDVDEDVVLSHIRARSDSAEVKLVNLDRFTPPPEVSHFHIYVCGPDHRYASDDQIPSTKKKYERPCKHML